MAVTMYIKVRIYYMHANGNQDTGFIVGQIAQFMLVWTGVLGLFRICF